MSSYTFLFWRSMRSAAKAVPDGAQFLFKRFPTFQLCGYTGFFLSFVQSSLLVRHLHLSQLTLLGITGTVILTFYVLMMITKIVARGEVIIYYHHEIAVIAAGALFLRLTNQPVLPYLDILVLGLGVFLACGRIGCLMVGCCHGRPCRWGVSYGQDHARAGFPRYLVDVKLFPIQAVESILASCIVACGYLLLLRLHKPGSVLAFYILAYACVRFCLEFFRGDAGRPYLFGFSEAQWTSIILSIVILIDKRFKIVWGSEWHWAFPASLGTAMIFLSLWRQLDRSHRFNLLHPRHVREVVTAIEHLDALMDDACANPQTTEPGTIHVAQTSRGYRLSAGKTRGASGFFTHYCLSKRDGTLTPDAARLLARLIRNFQPRCASFVVVEGREGVFHILPDVFADSSQPIFAEARR